MRKKIIFFILIAFFLLSGFKKAGSVLAQQAQANQIYASQGEVLGVKEDFLKFVGFLKSPKASLAHWLIGEMVPGVGEEELKSEGILPLLVRALIMASIGTAEETWSRVAEAGGGGEFNYVLPSSMPPGAIVMPPGDWYFTGGVAGMTGQVIASVFANPAASGIYYASDILHRLGGTPAYAANGIGFDGLKPILGLWKAFRNVAYSVFAIAMLITGMMIMFRVKISPQAILTIENALPRMIGILVLITFSYAIAGFMIDLMYVVIGLSIYILEPNLPSKIFVGGAGFANFIATRGGIFTLASGLVGGWGAFALLGAVIGTMLSPSFASATLGGLIFAFVGIVIVIFLFFKLLFALIKTYINIILLIIFSPILIAVGVFPGSPGGFGSWLKNLAANILVFPAVILVMVIGAGISFSILTVGPLWYPPLMGPPDIPVIGALTGGVAGVFIKLIIGVGFLMILPNIPDIVRNAFGIKDSGIGGMIGATLGGIPGVSMVKGGVQKAGEGYIASQFDAEKGGLMQGWNTRKKMAETAKAERLAREAKVGPEVKG